MGHLIQLLINSLILVVIKNDKFESSIDINNSKVEKIEINTLDPLQFFSNV